MPRPKKDDPRDVNFTFRLSIDETLALERRSMAAGMTKAVYARRRIFGSAAEQVTAAAEPRGGRHTPTPPAELVEQVRRIGVNLNQIARRMNERREPPPRELTSLLAEVRQVVRQARAFTP
ncbi:MAG: plasmid mobilization relaxosome protein MobC [Alphaproteobacteria bacterium]|nr:plasmid mobilization relaxosome protein MobC [Alphaproteobacteria bacterium]